jgi:hypothetical protein
MSPLSLDLCVSQIGLSLGLDVAEMPALEAAAQTLSGVALDSAPTSSAMSTLFAAGFASRGNTGALGACVHDVHVNLLLPAGPAMALASPARSHLMWVAVVVDVGFVPVLCLGVLMALVRVLDRGVPVLVVVRGREVLPDTGGVKVVHDMVMAVAVHNRLVLMLDVRVSPFASSGR